MAKFKKKIPKKILSEGIHLPYRRLLTEYPNWGINLANKKEWSEKKNHPDTETLQFAFLTVIVDLLREIRDELRKERIIR
jgi:hypothetical protein